MKWIRIRHFVQLTRHPLTPPLEIRASLDPRLIQQVCQSPEDDRFFFFLGDMMVVTQLYVNPQQAQSDFP